LRSTMCHLTLPVAHPFRGEVFPNETEMYTKARKTLRPEGLSFRRFSR
jgi:hypothetical protein